MKLIANGINGEYLSDILREASGKTDSVLAAVAYVTSTELLDWCIEQKIPLKLWARIDRTLPVSASILERFCKSSNSYSIKLINDFYHPKILFLEGYGIYIGSANLTDSAWKKNIECGVFYDQNESDTNGLTDEIRKLFAKIDSYSTPLTHQILEAIKRIEKMHFITSSSLSHEENQLRKDYEDLIVPKLSKNFKGLVQTTKSSATDRKKEEFMTDWNFTQEVLHKIGDQIVMDGNRPKWIPASTPLGVQVDQFLHAYYYKFVRDGLRSIHEELHSKNLGKHQEAVNNLISWWRDLQNAPSGEDITINEWAPVLYKNLERNSIARWNKEQFVEVATRLHAFRTNARQTGNEVLGLASGTHHNIDSRAIIVAEWMWDNSASNGYTVKTAIEYLLYGGNESEITDRLFSLTFGQGQKVYRLGIGTYGELIGWAMPNKFPPRNGRTSKALYALGFDVVLYGD